MDIDIEQSLSSWTEKAVVIPFRGNSDTNITNPLESITPFRGAESRDLPDGPILRFKVYQACWRKCLNRVRDILRRLHEPVIADILKAIDTTYTVSHPLLPYHELPVISVAGLDRNSVAAVVHGAMSRFTSKPRIYHDEDQDTEGSVIEISDDEAEPVPEKKSAFVVSMTPLACTNVASAMKQLVTGFIETRVPGLPARPKHKVSATLASYDIKLLEAWYDAMDDALGEDPWRRLLVVMLDFEDFEQSVVSDVFYICRKHIPRLPFVFLLALSSPPIPSYIHAVYPRNTLALLHLQRFKAKGGKEVLEDILLQTFFDPDFVPPLHLGPSTLEFISELCLRTSMSSDFVMTLLQLIHMRHFGEPLSVLVSDSLLGTPDLEEADAKLKETPSRNFIGTLAACLGDLPAEHDEIDGFNEEVDQSPWDGLLQRVDELRTDVRAEARRSKIAFGLFRTTYASLCKLGFKPKGSNADSINLMIESLNGSLRRGSAEGAKFVRTSIGRLTCTQLSQVLEEIGTYIEHVPHDTRTETALEEDFEGLCDRLPVPPSDHEDVQELAGDLATWMQTYCERNMVDITKRNFWDLWYTGDARSMLELINPSPQATVISGLLHSERYLHRPYKLAGETRVPDVDIPDTSLLFQRYLNSGKMINVYDWYESFGVALETEKEEREATLRKSRSKGKGKARADQQDDSDGDGSEEHSWQREVQARFIRSIHELDWMGFIKHTGRKADHVQKTVWNKPDS